MLILLIHRGLLIASHLILIINSYEKFGRENETIIQARTREEKHWHVFTCGGNFQDFGSNVLSYLIIHSFSEGIGYLLIQSC